MREHQHKLHGHKRTTHKNYEELYVHILSSLIKLINSFKSKKKNLLKYIPEEVETLNRPNALKIK